MCVVYSILLCVVYSVLFSDIIKMEKIVWNFGKNFDSIGWGTAHCCVQHVIHRAGYLETDVPTVNTIIEKLKIERRKNLSIENIRKILGYYSIGTRPFFVSKYDIENDSNSIMDLLYEIKKYITLFKLPVIVSKTNQSFCVVSVTEDLTAIEFFDPHTLFDSYPETAPGKDFFTGSTWIICCPYREKNIKNINIL